MEYNFTAIEEKVRAFWKKENVYKVERNESKPKCYVLDMFPYPSGAGLHVGHPLGYIASDIYTRYKRLKGFNVLHPMGFDAFGLPAEQYALETGQHPAITTDKNILRYKEQLNNIGFSFDWEREVRTCEPEYYKWTQWIFLQLFHSWYDNVDNKAKPIAALIEIFEKHGNKFVKENSDSITFSAVEWHQYNEQQKRETLMEYRLAYLDYADVWWCEALGTVLANDEVVNGVSERGGHPVVKKKLRQWFLRITDYAERLLESLDTLEWSEAMKEMQRNWIGKSVGAEIRFMVDGYSESNRQQSFIQVFTTRPDTIFGVDFMVLAPEHKLVASITTIDFKASVDNYVQYVKSRSERERISEVKQVTGCFTGAYALHPFSGKRLPIWISEYVLAGYGTGAIMAVPSGDERDHTFAVHFKIPITNIFGNLYSGNEAYSSKIGVIENSGFLSGLNIADATEKVLNEIEQNGFGKRKVNYRLRDAGFSRQRYWGEPFPIIYVDDEPFAADELTDVLPKELTQLPFILPKAENYKPGPEGQGPLANIEEWVTIPDSAIKNFDSLEPKVMKRETNTMPGYAGSSWYFLRYMDPKNKVEFADRKEIDYWQQVDLYVGGSEHAVGHLLYARMWTKVLYDLGKIGFDEPFKRLLNQGMIQGVSYFTGAFSVTLPEGSRKVYLKSFQKDRVSLVSEGENDMVTEEEKHFHHNQRLRFGHLFVDTKDRLTKAKYAEQLSFSGLEKEEIEDLLVNAEWAGKTEDGEDYIQCKMEVEKMSKSKYNVVNPDEIVAKYGADTFRLYEMFLGPIDMSKPWDTKGIEGVFRFLKKMWRLFYDEQKGLIITNAEPNEQELRTLHKAIKKVTEDIEKFSFNTSVSQFMITVNELSSVECHKRVILEPLVILICPFAPHFAEELWQQMGNAGSVVNASFPLYNEIFLVESTKRYPIAINGKPRTEMDFAVDAEQAFVENEVLADATVQKWLEGKGIKKFIYVKGKMINIVV